MIRLLLEADSYPRVGNEDWPVGARMEAAALEKVATAVASPDDPPEFARWLEGLRNPDLSADEREEIYWAIHDYFAEEKPQRARLSTGYIRIYLFRKSAIKCDINGLSSRR